ncbi:MULTISPECIES: hypothetical protein [Oceanobacillus]|uniref:DUF1641 domain-containing protein n=1 Tax=Oceanobacillus aidingensis TaxID=645964 RepID=A0ABV9JZI2_9BACI|nr:hypothetical protein [Oceanobacillus oncorhynchi]MDM8102263.1 hypothetical protein [Oceanobacillus oncorhynchi]
MDTTQKQSTMDDVIQELEKKEQVDALYYLVQKLPDFVSRVQKLDDKLDFIENVIEDKQSLSTISNEIEEKIENLHINQEHLTSLLELMHLLPKLVPLLKKADEVSQFVNDFLNDTASVEYALKGINDIIPLDKAVKVIKETNEQYKQNDNTANFSLYGMYRLLKDPTIQKGFRYLESFLEVADKEK